MVNIPPPPPSTSPSPPSYSNHSSHSIQPPISPTRTGNRGRPRKYNFGDVSAEEYNRLSKLEANKVSRLKQRKLVEGKNVIVLNTDNEAATPWIDTPNQHIQKLFQDYINANKAMWLGVEQFKTWIHNEYLRVENMRAQYISAVTKEIYGRE